MTGVSRSIVSILLYNSTSLTNNISIWSDAAISVDVAWAGGHMKHQAPMP